MFKRLKEFWADPPIDPEVKRWLDRWYASGGKSSDSVVKAVATELNRINDRLQKLEESDKL